MKKPRYLVFLHIFISTVSPTGLCVLCTVRHKVIYTRDLTLSLVAIAPTELMRKVLCGTASCQNRQRPFSEQ